MDRLSHSAHSASTVARMGGSVVVGPSESDAPTGSGPPPAIKAEQSAIEPYDNPLASSQLHRHSMATGAMTDLPALGNRDAGHNNDRHGTIINANRLHPHPLLPLPMTRHRPHQPTMMVKAAANGSLLYQQPQPQQQQQHYYLPQTLPLRPIYQQNMSAAATAEATPLAAPRGRARPSDIMTDGSRSGAAHQVSISRLAPPQVYDTTSYSSHPVGRLAGATVRQGPSYVSEAGRTAEPRDADEDRNDEQQDDATAAADESRVREPGVDAASDQEQEQEQEQDREGQQTGVPEQQDGDLDERSGGREFSEDESESTERDPDGNEVIKERKHLINGRPVSRSSSDSSGAGELEAEPDADTDADADTVAEGETDPQSDAAGADRRLLHQQPPRLTSRSGDLISGNSNSNQAGLANSKREQMRTHLNEFNELVGEFDADDKQRRRQQQQQSKQDEDQVMDKRMDSGGGGGGSGKLALRPAPSVNGLPVPVRPRSSLTARGVSGGGGDGGGGGGSNSGSSKGKARGRQRERKRSPAQRNRKRRVLQATAAKTIAKPSDLHEHRLTETLSAQQWDDDQRNGSPESSLGELQPAPRELRPGDGSVLQKDEQLDNSGSSSSGGADAGDDFNDDEQPDNDADKSERLARGPEAGSGSDEGGGQVDAPRAELSDDDEEDDDEDDDDDGLGDDSMQSSASRQVPSRETILARVKRAVESGGLFNDTDDETSSRNISAGLSVDRSDAARLPEPIKGAEDLSVEVLAEPPTQVSIETGGGASATYTTEPADGGGAIRNGSSPGTRYVAVAPAQLATSGALPVAAPPYATNRFQVHQVAVEAPEPFPLGVVANYDAVTKESAPKVEKSGKKSKKKTKKKKKYASEKKRSMMSESKYDAAKAQSAKRKSKMKKGGKKMKKKKSHKHLHAMDKYFSGAQSGKKTAKGKGHKGADTGELYYKDKGFKKKGFRRAYHKVESGDHKSYFDEFRDKDHKKKWKQYNDKHKYSQRKKWKGGEKKRVAGHKLNESKAKKLHKGKWKSSEMHKYGKSGKRKHAKEKSAHGKWKYKEKELSDKYKKKKKKKSHH